LNDDSDSVEPSDKTVKYVAPKNYIEQLKDLWLRSFQSVLHYFILFHFHCTVTVNAVRFQPAISSPACNRFAPSHRHR